MEKEELVSALKTGRADFLKLLQGFSDQQMEAPGVVEHWSIKDILVHLTRWEAEIIKLLWQAKQGITPTTAHFSGKTVDDINNLWYEESQSRSMKIVKDDFLGVRKQTIRRAEGYAVDRLNRARGDSARFVNVYESYRMAPEVTRKRIYLETMNDILPKVSQKIIIDDDLRGLLPLLNLNPQVPRREEKN